MAKNKSRTTAIPAPNKRGSGSGRQFRSRSEREAQANRLVLLASAAIFGLIVLLVGGALFIDLVLTPNQPVAAAGGQSISTRDFQNRVRFERWRSGTQLAQYIQLYGVQNLGLSDSTSPFGQRYEELAVPSTMGQRVLTDMINNILIEKYAAANNITVDQKDIDQEAFQSFAYNPDPKTPTPTTVPSATPTLIISPTPSPTSTNTPVPTITATPLPPTPTSIPTGIPTPTPGPTEQRVQYEKDRKSYLDQAAKAVGLSDADLQKIFREQALRKKVLQKIAGDPPKDQEQSDVRHILVPTEQQANDVMAALKSGESFAALARAVSTDNGQQAGQPDTGTLGGSAAQGGELGWAGRDASYVKEFNDAIWNAKPGDVVGPIKSQFGYHIIQVEARETRPLTDAEGQQKQTTTFDKWLKDQRDKDSQQYSYWLDRVPSDPSLTDLNLPQPSDIPASNTGGLPLGQ